MKYCQLPVSIGSWEHIILSIKYGISSVCATSFQHEGHCIVDLHLSTVLVQVEFHTRLITVMKNEMNKELIDLQKHVCN